MVQATTSALVGQIKQAGEFMDATGIGHIGRARYVAGFGRFLRIGLDTGVIVDWELTKSKVAAVVREYDAE